MNFDRMRALLLERAIRGELVPQLTEDGSIEQVGNGRGLFDIPKSWGWFEFSKVVKTLSSRGNQIPAKEICERGRFPVVTQSKNSLIDGYSEEESKLVPKAFLPLLVFGDHTRFLKYVDFQFIVGADGTKLIRPKDDGFVNCSYLYYVLRALVPETKDRGYSRHFQFLKKLMIPVPPIHEQCRIVDRVEELLSEINRAEKAYEELQTLAGVLRGQILQEAIEGKLVPQLAEEGVVEQIGAAPEEVPFKIPESWSWIRVEELAVKRRTIDPSTLTNDEIELWSIPAFDAGVAEKVSPGDIGSSKKVVQVGDVLLAKIVPHIKRVWVVSESANSLMKLASTEWLVYASELFLPEFMGLLFRAPYFRTKMMESVSGMGSLKRANPRILAKVWLPVPPIAEQARIVTKVEELLKQVDALST